MDKSATIPAAPALEGELWRDIPGYEGLYRVSNRGRVLSLPRFGTTGTQGGRMLKLVPKGRPGYERLGVTLSKDNVKWQCTVHQLVMLAFVGPPGEGQEVRHLDGNPFNNRWEPGDEAETKAAGGNLFYGSHKQNGKDMSDHGSASAGAHRGSEHYRAKLTEEIVRRARIEHAAGATELALAAKYRVNGSTMHRLLVRKTWQHVA